MKLLILKGLPGSGKTTWSREFVEKNKNWIRVNRDDLRNMRGEYFIPKQEDLITDWENATIAAALNRGYSVILDATNLNDNRTKTRLTFLKTIISKEYRVAYKTFDTSLEDCIKNDLKRANSVGEKVIKGMYNRYCKGKTNEGIYSEDIKLPHCVIFDMDGTLALKGDRSPYDWSKVIEDTVNVPIMNLLITFKKDGKKIIIFTGRDGRAEGQTRDWLIVHQIPFDELYIRPEENTIKDSIIKMQMFEKHIRNKYYCDLVVDDRNQVVKMWRNDLGLTCLQVADGDF